MAVNRFLAPVSSPYELICNDSFEPSGICRVSNGDMYIAVGIEPEPPKPGKSFSMSISRPCAPGWRGVAICARSEQSLATMVRNVERVAARITLLIMSPSSEMSAKKLHDAWRVQ